MQEDKANETELNDDAEAQTDEQQEKQSEEFEISLAGSPSDTPHRQSPKVRRIIGQREKARGERDEARERINALEQENEVLKQAAKGKPSESPKWEDFSSDEEYQTAVQEWVTKNQSSTKPKEHINPADFYNAFEQKQAKEQAINRHYSKAEELIEKFPDYSAAEESAVKTLGQGLVDEIATLSEKSAELMLYFGRNDAEAMRFKHLAETNPQRAAIELGKLEATVNVQPKQSEQLPDPDEALSGATPSPKLSKLEKQLEQARSKGDVAAAIDIKRQMREAS